MSDDDAEMTGPDGYPLTRLICERRTPRFSWTPAYEKTFFKSLCDSVKLGLRENSSFKAEAWSRAAHALEKSHGAYPTKSHLINKSDNARKRFRLWRGLREHPDFLYNPHTRVVTASKDVWNAHIAREPLSRALRGRPFEHEDYMEILYPDVIGSGGAPKRIMKPRKRADEPEETPMPGTSILDLQMGPTASPDTAGQPRPAMAISTPTATTPMQMPPDESANQAKKRALPHERPVNGLDPKPPTTPGSTLQVAPSPETGARVSQGNGLSSGHGVTAASATPMPSTASPQPALDDESAVEEADAAKRKLGLEWQEAALDAFFRDFADLDADLQLNITEAVLCDEYKALLFCKMPGRVRQHWVARLAESGAKPA